MNKLNFKNTNNISTDKSYLPSLKLKEKDYKLNQPLFKNVPNKPFFPYIQNPHYINLENERKNNNNEIKVLPREIIKWLQSLYLTTSIKNIKKDFLNGFLIAQIYNRYFKNSIPMHTIENGLSSNCKYNNWRLLQKYLKAHYSNPDIQRCKSEEYSKKIDNLVCLANDKTGQETLKFLILTYKELTDSDVDFASDIYTDVDNINKSFVLNNQGEPENKNNVENISDEEVNNEVNKTTLNNSEAINNVPALNTINKSKESFIMKGEQKPISQANTKQEDKHFNIKFTEPIPVEKIYSSYKPINNNNNNNSNNVRDSYVNESNAYINTKNNKSGVYNNEDKTNSKLINSNPEYIGGLNNNDLINENKLPFDKLEHEIQRMLANKFPEEYNIINNYLPTYSYITNNNHNYNNSINKNNNQNNSEYENEGNTTDRFLFFYFKHLDVMSINSLYECLKCIKDMIDINYNILGEQPNEFISLFYILFDAYCNASNILETFQFESNKNISKFLLLHRYLITDFFKSCQKNKAEDMNYSFRYIILENIFEKINNNIYEQKVATFCELLYTILQPIESQQFSFIKLIKDNLISEENFYNCLGYFCLLFGKSLSEQFVEGCLFYILNGLSSELKNIRYNCLLMIYCLINNVTINFYNSFEKFLDSMSLYEEDLENCIYIVKILVLVLNIKQKTKETLISKSQLTGIQTYEQEKNNVDDISGENININLINNNNKELLELNNPIKLVKNLLFRYIDYDLFMVISLSYMTEIISDNYDIHKIFIYCLVKSPKVVIDYIFYNKKLNINLKKKLNNANFKTKPDLSIKNDNWNYGLVFKAYSNIFLYGLNDNLNFNKENKMVHGTYLRDQDYVFLNHCFSENLENKYSENWKLGFKDFSKYIIQDLSHEDKCERSLKIIEKFLDLDSIQKHISEEIQGQLESTIQDIVKQKNEKCYNIIIKYLNKISSSSNCSSMLKDSIRKLLNIKYV